MCDLTYDKIAALVEKYRNQFELLQLRFTVNEYFGDEFKLWCYKQNVSYTTIKLPYEEDEVYDQIVTTIKILPSTTRDYVKLFRDRWNGDEIMGYKIEGIEYKGSVIPEDLCYIELHGNYPGHGNYHGDYGVDGEKDDVNEDEKLWSYSRQQITYAFRGTDKSTWNQHVSSKFCILDEWIDDIEAPWKELTSRQQLNCSLNFVLSIM